MTEKKAQKSPLTDQLDLPMVANFAHQLINPLNGVAGTLDRLYQGKIEGEGRQRQRINAMRAQIENCIVLTRNLAYLAIGFGELQNSDKGSVILPQSLIEASQFHQEEANFYNLEIYVNNREIQNSVFAHADLLRQVFMNIIDNAVKYSKEGTRIEIEHQIQAKSGHAIIYIRSFPKKFVSPEDLSKMFELGYRGEGARQILASGTGLGLYICKKIIETAHSGKISAARYKGNGIEFIIRIPNGSVEQKSQRN